MAAMEGQRPRLSTKSGIGASHRRKARRDNADAMSAAFAAALALVPVGVAFVLYPFSLALLSLISPRRAVADQTYLPTVGVLVAAYNEEAVIAAKIKDCLALDYPRHLLSIVVASESNDRTNAIIREMANPLVRLLEYGRMGKSAMLTHSVPLMDADVIVLTDADARVRPDAIYRLVGPLADPRVACAVGQLVLEPATGDAGSTEEAAYWRLESFLKRLASAHFAVLGANGALYAVKRACFKPLTEDRADDFEIAVQVRVFGGGVVFVPEAVATERTTQSTRHQFRRKTRMTAWCMQSAVMLLGASIRNRRYGLAVQLIAHKILRWLTPWLVLTATAIGCFGSGSVLTVTIIVVSIVTVMALFEMASPIPRPLRPLLYAAAMFAAGLAGVVLALVPRQRNTYEPALED